MLNALPSNKFLKNQETVIGHSNLVKIKETWQPLKQRTTTTIEHFFYQMKFSWYDCRMLKFGDCCAGGHWNGKKWFGNKSLITTTTICTSSLSDWSYANLAKKEKNVSWVNPGILNEKLLSQQFIHKLNFFFQK